MTVTGDARARTTRLSVLDRVAGAPISWGVCEVPGWGWQYDPATVLTEMREVGLRATEFGPEDFLPEAPEAKAALLGSHGLAAVGQFVPVVLHDPDHDPLPEVHLAMDGLVAAHASTVVLAAATGPRGTTPVRCSTPRAGRPCSPTSTGSTWRPPRVASRRPCTPTSAPWSSPARRPSGCCGAAASACASTPGTCSSAAATRSPSRSRARTGSPTSTSRTWRPMSPPGSATRAQLHRRRPRRMYRPLGAGDVDVAAIVTSLENAGYAGWYVLEQDTILDAEPTESGGTRPPVDDVRVSLDHLRAVAATLVPRD